MGAWQENLLSNLLVVGILLSIAIIIYCKVTNKTLTDVFRELIAIGKIKDE